MGHRDPKIGSTVDFATLPQAEHAVMVPFFTRCLRVAGWPSIPQEAFLKFGFATFGPKVATSALAKHTV